MPTKVLIVDDDKDFLDELGEALSRNGYKTTTVSDSTSAVKAARTTRPDVILLDLKMRSLSGFEVADRLRRSEEMSNIPVIAITGFYTLKEHSWLMNFCGIKKCLKKPFSPDKIIAEIEKVLKARSEDGY